MNNMSTISVTLLENFPSERRFNCDISIVQDGSIKMRYQGPVGSLSELASGKFNFAVHEMLYQPLSPLDDLSTLRIYEEKRQKKKKLQQWLQM
jgi:hypothetical protein